MKGTKNTRKKISKFYQKGFEIRVQERVNATLNEFYKQECRKMMEIFMNGDPAAPQIQGILKHHQLTNK